MDISKGGNRAPNGKVYPNQKQRRLLRKLVAERREYCEKAGIVPVRYKLGEFRKWAPALNKLGPPVRSAAKWKNCWFNHKRQRNFFEFYYQKVREDYQKEKDVCEVKLPKKRKVCRKMQIRKFIELLKQRREESEARGEPFATITSEDFKNWTKILNKLGPVYPVEKWKMTWKSMKKQKKDNTYFNPEDFSHYKEVGCGSSEEFYLSDDNSFGDEEGAEASSGSDQEAGKSRRRRKRRRKLSHSEDCDPVTAEEIDQSYTNLCRICLKQRKTMKTFVDGSYKNISYLDIYHECIGEAFKIYSFCSTDICDLCEKNFLNMYIFRGLCLQADTKLSFIENQKEDLSDSQEDGSDDEDNIPLSEINFPVDHVDSEMEGLDEKSIPEDIQESLEKKGVLLNSESVDQQDIFHDVKMICPESSKMSVKSEENTSENADVTNPISPDPIQCKEELESDVEAESEMGFVPSCDETSDEDTGKAKKVRRKRKESAKIVIGEHEETLKTPKTKKERPNKAQIELLRKLIAEKKGKGEKFGVREFRLKKYDFERWAEKLNALGPPQRPSNKWKDCWFVHKKKKNNFYDFLYRQRRKQYSVGQRSHGKLQRLNADPKCRKKMTRKQLNVFESFFEERIKNAGSSEKKLPLSTNDFKHLQKSLNALGPPFRSANEWKLTWKYTKKNSLKPYAAYFKETGYESSDAYYFTNDSSDDDSDVEVIS